MKRRRTSKTARKEESDTKIRRMAAELYAESAGKRYKLQTLPDFRKFRELAFNTDSAWVQHFKDSMLTVESKPPDDSSTSINVIRAKKIMPRVPPRVLYDQLQDASYRATWDTNMLEGFNIVVLDAHNDIGYYAAKFPFPLSDRDFCNLRSWMEFTNGDYVIFNHSVEHAECPVKKNLIRAKSFLSGYYIQPYQNGEGTYLTFVTHSDPCGSIPKSIINFAMTKGAPRILSMCEKRSEDYPAFAAKTYSEGYVYPWTTPKMDWDSPYLYPELVPSNENNTAKIESDEQRNSLSGEVETIDTRDKVPKGKVPSLVPQLSLRKNEPPEIQKYRLLMQECLDGVDRSFLIEDTVPNSRQYLIRLKCSVEGIRQTL